MKSVKYKAKKITISDLGGNGFVRLFLMLFGSFVDFILGIHKINSIYQNATGEGITKEDFVKNILKNLEIHYNFPEENLKRIPGKGSIIIVANHPYGGLEGVILAHILSSIRPDIKIMANVGLRIIPELRDFFIFTNPLKTHNPKNIKSIKECRKHLENKGLLLLFPAGKVAYYRKEYNSVADGDWSKIAAYLALDLNISVQTLFISGQNSQFFLALGRLYYRFRLLMLPREFAKKKRDIIEIRCSYPIPPSILRQKGKSDEVTSYLRMVTYLMDPFLGKRIKSKNDDSIQEMSPLLERIDKKLLLSEIKQIPENQYLADFQHFSVYCGLKKQIPQIVHEITILREKTFREFDEGSGHPCDTDNFDDTYTHLFIWNNRDLEIIGAYRMGQSDLIPERYLTHMFDFTENFLKNTTPPLEMGRSFIVKEHQKSFYGLFLLWRGIGEFCVRNPQYRILYGTVSLSYLYDNRSISLIDRVLTTGDSTVKAKAPYVQQLQREVDNYLKEYTLGFKELSLMVRSIESDGKDIPILIKQYWKLGAKFLINAIDTSFGDTPGLLLVVNLPETPKSSLKMYMEDGLQGYLEYDRHK